jgi:hypothetical protein
MFSQSQVSVERVGISQADNVKTPMSRMLREVGNLLRFVNMASPLSIGMDWAHAGKVLRDERGWNEGCYNYIIVK